ncbi:MAG TPA: P-loop NTPase [Spirochaetota bacterium]|nr:P-loop NTPase [Spirochaetota bacterium]
MIKQTTIVISSGKGGTGKTFVSTNIARVLEKAGHAVRYLDCDVEEPNGHLFLKPVISKEEDAVVFSPVGIDHEKCTGCGLCEAHCNYNAIAVIKGKALFFQDLCHICGACILVCPENAIVEKDRVIGKALHGTSGSIDVHYAVLKTGEGGMSPRLIKNVKRYIGEGINILDSPPGTSCPVVETVRDSDICVLVTDPTPFGLNDLKLSVDMCRATGIEPVVLVNRAEKKYSPLDDYCKEEKLEIIGEIPDDRAIAECYSIGDMAVDKLPHYEEAFRTIAEKILIRSQEKRPPLKSRVEKKRSLHSNLIKVAVKNSTSPNTSKEVVVISGKGGTGKTSIAASFCAIEKNIVISDCDVDAADLHLVLAPEIKERGDFSGGVMAEIDPEKCTGCGKCFSHCRFDAIKKADEGGRTVYRVDEISCEGCGVCSIVCKFDAVKNEVSVNGEWYVSDTRFGPMSHAKLGVAEENSGKLVSLVRNKKNELAERYNIRKTLVDGSPGTGCPVIASITGTDYALVVTEPTVSGIHDLERVLDVIKFFNVSCGIIVNKSDLNPAKSEEIRTIAGEHNADFLGMIPYDKSITHAQMQGISVIEYADNETTEKIREIWGKVSLVLAGDA